MNVSHSLRTSKVSNTQFGEQVGCKETANSLKKNNLWTFLGSLIQHLFYLFLQVFFF